MANKSIGPTGLGRLIGESKQNVERWQKGQHKLVPDMARKIAPHLGVTAANLLLVATELFQVPLAGHVGAGGAIIDVEADTSEHRRYVDILAGPHEDAAAAEVSGASLGQFEGWFAIFRDRGVFRDDLYGRLCVMQTSDGETLIKWVARTRKRGVKLLSGDLSVYADGVHIEWIAPVIGLRPPR